MEIRNFSDTVKYQVLTENIAKNSGDVRCEVCGKKILSIADCHFDHIIPYAKGGKTIKENCQILCVSCNEKKKDKELHEFIWEEKARQFLSGVSFDQKETANEPKEPAPAFERGSMTKEAFDAIVSDFIAQHGTIRKVDFTKASNDLPSTAYIQKYYGSLSEMKKAFGVKDLSGNWTRETILEAIKDFVDEHGEISTSDLKSKNNLPSAPCILANFPEVSTWTEFKSQILNLQVREHWTRERAICAGKAFVKENGRVFQKDLRQDKGLPSYPVISSLFGNMAEYQKAVGSPIADKAESISKEQIAEAVDAYFSGRERIADSMSELYAALPITRNILINRYHSESAFCKEFGITIINGKNYYASKKDVDEPISKWIKAGKPIPGKNELTKNGLPSKDSILKFYNDWKEPFILYQKLYDEFRKD